MVCHIFNLPSFVPFLVKTIALLRRRAFPSPKASPAARLWVFTALGSAFQLCFLALLCCQNAVSQSTHTPLRKGDRAYDRSNYKEAERQYRIAADRDVGNPQAVYNLGNTLYQQGNWEVAEERYQQVAAKNLPSAQRADVLHNLGDSFLKQRKYKEAVQAYEESLRLRPGDPGTKQNLQMAKKRLREEQNKAQQNQHQQQNQDPNEGQQQHSPQDQQQPPQDQTGQPKQDTQGQPQQSQNQPNQKEMEQRLKKEDAKRLLETAVGPADRKNAQKYRSAQPATKPKDGKKDWK